MRAKKQERSKLAGMFEGAWWSILPRTRQNLQLSLALVVSTCRNQLHDRNRVEGRKAARQWPCPCCTYTKSLLQFMRTSPDLIPLSSSDSLSLCLSVSLSPWPKRAIHTLPSRKRCKLPRKLLANKTTNGHKPLLDWCKTCWPAHLHK